MPRFQGRVGAITNRKIRMAREEKRLTQVAQERGFEDSDALIRDMYITQGKSIKDIQEELFTPMWSLKKRLVRLGIPFRSRGGPNNVITHITRELVEECLRDGVNAVADRLGITTQLLSSRMKKWCESNAPELLQVIEEEE